MQIKLYSCIFAFWLFCCHNNNAKSRSDDQLCTNNHRSELENHFSTKTPYRVVANVKDEPLKYPGCKPTRIWSVIRHGARNPSKKVIDFAKENLTDLKQRILNQSNHQLCDAELQLLREWNFTINGVEEKFLVAEGEDELVGLAERMQKRFPEVLPETYDPALYYFKFTATQRTFKSAESFATGLFGRHNINQIIFPEAVSRDPILRFYKRCNRWKQEVDNNPETFRNAKKFTKGREYQAAVKFMEEKLQLNLTAKQAQQIYTVCAFETAWNRHNEPSVWCNLFNNETIKVFEFAEDLEYYWNDGYGYELTQKIACPAISNMFEHIDPNSKKPFATFYFTHSGTMLKLLTYLGLYKDATPITYKDFNKNRLWQTSSIDSFASNLAFVLYDCNTEPMVLTLHQERVVHLPNCPKNQDLCSLSTLQKTYSDSLNQCNFDEICNLN